MPAKPCDEFFDILAEISCQEHLPIRTQIVAYVKRLEALTGENHRDLIPPDEEIERAELQGRAPQGMKRCTKCGQMKPLSAFYKEAGRGPDGHRNECKECFQAIRRDRRG